MTHPLIGLMVEAASEPGQPSEPENETTEAVLQAMLTENTGRHLLDSGGAYGRAWERNQGRDFDTEDDATLDFYVREAGKYDRDRPEGDLTIDLMVTVNVYHFLKERLEYAPEADAAFRRWCEIEDEAPYLGGIEEYAESRHASGIDNIMTVNTYNGEDSLSQVLQYTVWKDAEDDEVYIGLSIHGGADVRGGYTDVRIFTCYGEPYALMDNADWTIHCDGSGQPDQNPGQLGLDGEPVGESHCGLWWDCRGGHLDSDEHPMPEDFPVERGTEGRKGVIVADEDEKIVFCPGCNGGKLVATAPYPSY